ncbi:MAG: hypothetical protein RL226_410 [Bacteroidota bacterium]|jgi:ADP-ribose pyrophosphatase YjhB (NUDIX family)
MTKKFNVRVYFLLVEGSRLLVSDELIRGKAYTKFPGGGLEFGEGTRDCCMREALEELGQPIHVGEHVYTTDFYIQSAFRPEDQVLSIYYFATLTEPQAFRTSNIPFDFQQFERDEESFRWVELSALAPDDFAFPADQHVVKLLPEAFKRCFPDV